ncbi:MAG: septation protein A [Hyphomicrobiaceae bacterium]
MTAQTTPDHHKNDSIGRQLLKLALELGPLIIFFVTNSSAGIFMATKAFMVATVISLVVSRLVFGRVAIMPLVTAVFVIVFGGLTIWLEDDHFIKLKPTIVNGLFAVILLGGVAFGHSLLRYVFGEVFNLSDEGWRQLTIRWGVFFIALAILNEIVWRNFSTDTWVAFKTFGIMPLTMIFALSQLGIIKKHDLSQIAPESEGKPIE